MTHKEQIEAFADDLTALIDRYIKEFDLVTADAVGVLEIKKHELIRVAFNDQDDE